MLRLSGGHPLPAKPFEFAIPVSWGPAPDYTPTAWLTESFGTTTAEHGEPADPGDPDAVPPREPRPAQPPAVRLRFRMWPNMAERATIQMRVDELFGGLSQAVDVDLALQDLYASCRLEYERAVFPDGRPKVTSPEEVKAQTAALDRMWAMDANSQKRVKMQRLEAMRDALNVAAEWPTLIVRPPPGWADLAALEIPPATNDLIVRAYQQAKRGAEQESGK
jgi:hypothetical protein